ncbi:hypothetical protein JMJ77_0014877, partial [Colletotrichum scovillei]
CQPVGGPLCKSLTTPLGFLSRPLAQPFTRDRFRVQHPAPSDPDSRYSQVPYVGIEHELRTLERYIYRP